VNAPLFNKVSRIQQTIKSVIYRRNGTVQLQIQLMEQLQKPMAKDSMTIKKLGEVQHYLRYLIISV